MRRGWLAAATIVGVVVATLATAPRAEAYEFEVRARTMAQLWQLRSFRVVGPDVWLERRRFTQTLELDLFDLGGLQAARARNHRLGRGPVVSFTGYLRLDHDFGSWTSGQLRLLEDTGAARDAIDVVPELAASSLAIDLLYGYVTVAGLVDGRVDVRIGRQVEVDTLDWWSMDGATVRVATPWRVAVEAFGGLRVRDASPLAPAVYELDGTTGADCREYVEGEIPGTGSWQLIDRSRVVGNDPFEAELTTCPQREQLMPTFGAAVETDRLGPVHARLTYRRTQSRSPGIIEPDRPSAFPDLGFYPNEHGQAPAWGVNEERLAATVRADLTFHDGRVQVSPWAAARYSLLHALVDEAQVGVRGRWGDHAVEPELSTTVPTFAGDSIFNVFGAEPSTDARVTYDWRPRGGRLQAFATAWLRWYQTGDLRNPMAEAPPTTGDPAEPTTSSQAGGGSAAVELRLTSALRARLDGLFDDGYGGRRAGGTASLRWRHGDLLVHGRAAVLDTAPDTHVESAATTSWAQLGGTWVLGKDVAVHGVGEASYNRFTPGQVRVLAVLDLAFVPEL